MSEHQQPGINIEPLARVQNSTLATVVALDGVELIVASNATATIELPNVAAYVGKTVSVCVTGGTATAINVKSGSGQTFAVAVALPTIGRTAIFYGISATQWSPVLA